MHLELNYVQLLELATQYTVPTTTASQQEHVEELRRTQSKSKQWFKFRACRITASRFHQVVHTNPHMPAKSLIRNVCYPEACQFTSTATQYGCIHEQNAVEAYKSRLCHEGHDQARVIPSGFVISLVKPFLGASLAILWCGQTLMYMYSTLPKMMNF